MADSRHLVRAAIPGFHAEWAERLLQHPAASGTWESAIARGHRAHRHAGVKARHMGCRAVRRLSR